MRCGMRPVVLVAVRMCDVDTIRCNQCGLAADAPKGSPWSDLFQLWRMAAADDAARYHDQAFMAALPAVYADHARGCKPPEHECCHTVEAFSDDIIDEAGYLAHLALDKRMSQSSLADLLDECGLGIR
jgi:hypothetical protein